MELKRWLVGCLVAWCLTDVLWSAPCGELPAPKFYFSNRASFAPGKEPKDVAAYVTGLARKLGAATGMDVTLSGAETDNLAFREGRRLWICKGSGAEYTDVAGAAITDFVCGLNGIFFNVKADDPFFAYHEDSSGFIYVFTPDGGDCRVEYAYQEPLSARWVDHIIASAATGLLQGEGDQWMRWSIDRAVQVRDTPLRIVSLKGDYDRVCILDWGNGRQVERSASFDKAFRVGGKLYLALWGKGWDDESLRRMLLLFENGACKVIQDESYGAGGGE